MVPILCLLFVLSGAAGLIYGSIWARYLGLFVGQTASAQIIVLVILLGGMSAGAMAVSRWSERLKQPLWAFAIIEFVLGYMGLFFHDVFQAVTGWAYATVYPELAGSWTLTTAKWAVTGALILPHSVLLGMTLPLIGAGLIRLARTQPGRILSLLYFSYGLGAAVGVLAAGFSLVALVGLEGTLLTAAILHLAVAAATGITMLSRRTQPRRMTTATPREAVPIRRTPAGLERQLILVSLGTAVGLMIYETAWMRMLALVLGSATHSLELMLSAFILGLALGAWWVAGRADRLTEPVRTLGVVQCTMGALALATLPLYTASFEWIALLLSALSRTDSGYAAFTIARYGLCLLIMLPATFCAGMTLPLITRTLMAHGKGERAVGAVYSWSILGSTAGIVLGRLVLLPALGLNAMLIVGALVGIGMGLLLLWRLGSKKPQRRLVMAAAAASLIFSAVVMGGVRLDTGLLSSGVYQTAAVTGEQEVTFYRDGRTATITASRLVRSGQISLATDGNPDASLDAVWFRPCDGAAGRALLIGDATTQTLLPLITLAHAPGARAAAIIGQGSGMSSHLLLGSPALREIVTIEIEPQMIEGSRAFYPANRRAFDDPRSHSVIEDARSWFGSEQRKFDIIMSQPSNPWSRGVSSIFTAEFYDRVRQRLTPDGVFGQRLHLNALDDDLVLSILAAIQQSFRSYEIYQVARGDVLVIAGNKARLPAPDWLVFQSPALQEDLCRFAPLTPQILDGLHLAGKRELAPLLQSNPQPNSDYFPVLDLGAERGRFRHDFAAGFPALSADWYNLVASQRGRRTPASQEVTLVFPESPRVWARAVGALLRQAGPVQTDGTSEPMSRDAMFRWRQWQSSIASNRAPASWELWLDQAGAMERLVSGGTAGIADEGFYAGVRRVLDRNSAPEPVRDVVAFRHDIATWQFTKASEVGERLMPLIARGERWMPADELRDGLLMARLHIKDVKGARRVFDTLTPLSVRPSTELRSQLLSSYLRGAEWMRASLVRRPSKQVSATP